MEIGANPVVNARYHRRFAATSQVAGKLGGKIWRIVSYPDEDSCSGRGFAT
jgi:hypothetical protein